MSEVSEDGSGSPLRTRSTTQLDNISEVGLAISLIPLFVDP
jgi:hypothetical protein